MPATNDLSRLVYMKGMKEDYLNNTLLNLWKVVGKLTSVNLVIMSRKVTFLNYTLLIKGQNIKLLQNYSK